MIHLRNMADWTGFRFDCDLDGLPAVVEDEICRGIEERDAYLIGEERARSF
jgi:hypothetical protein